MKCDKRGGVQKIKSRYTKYRLENAIEKTEIFLDIARDPIALRKKRQSGKSYLPNQAAQFVGCALSATIPFAASMTDDVFSENRY